MFGSGAWLLMRPIHPETATFGLSRVGKRINGLHPLMRHQAAREIAQRFKGFALRGMVPSPTPKQDHGDPQSFRFRSEGNGKLVRAEGLEPSRALRPNGFSCPLRLSPPLLSCRRVWGLDYPFTVPGFGSGCQVLPV